MASQRAQRSTVTPIGINTPPREHAWLARGKPVKRANGEMFTPLWKCCAHCGAIAGTPNALKPCTR